MLENIDEGDDVKEGSFRIHGFEGSGADLNPFPLCDARRRFGGFDAVFGKPFGEKLEKISAIATHVQDFPQLFQRHNRVNGQPVIGAIFRRAPMGCRYTPIGLGQLIRVEKGASEIEMAGFAVIKAARIRQIEQSGNPRQGAEVFDGAAAA